MEVKKKLQYSNRPTLSECIVNIDISIILKNLSFCGRLNYTFLYILLSDFLQMYLGYTVGQRTVPPTFSSTPKMLTLHRKGAPFYISQVPLLISNTVPVPQSYKASYHL